MPPRRTAALATSVRKRKRKKLTLRRRFWTDRTRDLNSLRSSNLNDRTVFFALTCFRIRSIPAGHKPHVVVDSARGVRGEAGCGGVPAIGLELRRPTRTALRSLPSLHPVCEALLRRKPVIPLQVERAELERADASQQRRQQ